MKRTNNLNKLKPISRMQTEQVPNSESANKPAPSKFRRFADIVWSLVLILFLAYIGYTIISDDIKTQNQIKANLEAVLNSPKMQEYRIREVRRQKEIEKRKKLKQLGVDELTNPMPKNDFLNERIRQQEIAESQEPKKTSNTLDYMQKLEIYRQAKEGKNQRP